MTNIGIVKDLLRQAYHSESKADTRRLLEACSAILDVTFREADPEPDPVVGWKLVKDPQPLQKTAPQPKTETKKGRKKALDTGKLKALRDAGWTVAKIADEMGVSEPTIRNYIHKLGI